jgi:hypothetical protein
MPTSRWLSKKKNMSEKGCCFVLEQVQNFTEKDERGQMCRRVVWGKSGYELFDQLDWNQSRDNHE